jgi:glycosyltransferase involved in cell wall biosynthesis
MKIMIFCWEQEISNEILQVAKFFENFNQDFILSPLIRIKDKPDYQEALSKLSKIAKNITVAPIYLKSANSHFSNLLNPNIFLNDFLSIQKVIKTTKPNVVICFYISHAYPLMLLTFFDNFSLCTVAMGSDVYLDNSCFQRAARKFVYQKSIAIFARSRKLKEKINEEYPGEVIVNPSSTDTSFFRPLVNKSILKAKWKLNSSDKVILTVCRLDKNKGVDVLLRALKLLDSNHFKLIIVGDGVEKPALKALSSSLGLVDKVSFMGVRSKTELLELYNLADVFALASYSEGLPRVLLEAMACQCIPITTDVGSVGDVVANNRNGFLTNAGCVDELKDKIELAFSLPEKQVALIKTAARQNVVEKFDSQKIWKEMIDKLVELMTKKDI